MSKFYSLRVSRSDITIPGKSKVQELYVEIAVGEERHRTRSVDRLPPQWNETFPIACISSDKENRITITLKKKDFLFDKNIGSIECSFKDILKESGEDACIFLQSKSGSCSLFLCLQPSDEMKNTVITLVNLAHVLFDIQPSDHDDIAKDVNEIFVTARNVAKSKECESLVEGGYIIDDFVKVGDIIAEACPDIHLKLAWSITSGLLKLVATTIDTDKKIRDLVKSLMGLFLDIEDASVFINPSHSLSLVITKILQFINECSKLIQGYTREHFIRRMFMLMRKAEISNLEVTLRDLKRDFESAFIRQDIIVTRNEARVEISEKLKEKLEKKLQPKHEGRTDRQICLEGTRVEVLNEIEDWVKDTNAPNVFFSLGRAGTGKSTIATTIAENYQRKGQLGSHQYFLRDKSDPAYIFRTIAYDLALRCQRTAEAINAQLDANDIITATPERAFEILLSEPLHTISMEDKKKDNILIVLDALDECGSRGKREPYIRLIKEKLQTLPLNYRFLVTSRPEGDIASSGELDKLRIRHMNLDHESENTRGDVLKYFQTKLGDLKERDLLMIEPEWPWAETMKILGEAANGLFIWASTAVRLIENSYWDMGGELKQIVQTKSLSLEKLYEDALIRSLNWNQAMITNYSRVFSLIMFGKEQLLETEINDFLGLGYGKTSGILNSLRSLVAFEHNKPVRLYHTSLYDYLVSKGARGKAWFIDEEREKAHISQRCFELMEGLRFNICDLETSYKLNKDVPRLEERVKGKISASLLYACRHWASHLREVPYSEDLCKQVESFALNRLLHWVEVLSLTGSLYTSLLQSLQDSITWIGNKHAQLSEFLQDAHAQFLRFIEPISQSTPHLYMSFLPLMKEDSIVAEHFDKHAKSLTRVEYVGNKPRMACTRQIYVGSAVISIAYSPDGDQIASGSSEGVVEIWDVVSGRRLLGPLRGHSNWVTSVAYSGDERYIASGSEDKTVRVWNAVTGESAYGPLTGHSGRITSVAFSVDGKYIASGSWDKTVRLWDAENGAPIGEPLREHSEAVTSVVFSPNGRYLASGSKDGTIILWNAESRKMISNSFKDHSNRVTSLSFSPDSERIASGSVNNTIRVWEVSSGRVLRAFSGDGMKYVFSVAFSSDGKHILSGSDDVIVRLWDAEDSEAPPKRFEGHTLRVNYVSFAPDSKHFASASWDRTIRVWDVEGGVTLADVEFRRHTNAIHAIAISPKTGKFFVSGSIDGTVCVWNTESGDLIKGPLAQSSDVSSVAFSPDENHFASGSFGSVQIWNMIDDEIITCNGHTFWVRSVAFSPDGLRLASGSRDKSIRVWNVESGTIAFGPLTGHTSDVISVCYSPDGKKIVSGSTDNTVRIWNVSNSRLLSTFEGHSDWVKSVTYSPDGLYVVSASDDDSIRVWNAETGQAAYVPITGHTDSVNSVCFSPDGKWIISGSDDKTICIWNVSTGVLFFQSRVSSPVYDIAVFPTSDSGYIKFASGSKDGVIHIWSVHIEEEGKKWRLEDDGWLTGNNGKYLIWIPPDLRHSLVHGPCIRTLNTRFSTKLYLSANQGDQWTACFPSPDLCIS